MKRGYWVHVNMEPEGIAVVAASAMDARKIAYASGEIAYEDPGWINVRAHWQRDADVDGLPVGVVDDPRVGLLRGMYAVINEYPCDACGKDADVCECGGRALCAWCADEEYLKEQEAIPDES